MKDFLKSVLASALGTMLTLAAGGFLLLVILMGLAGSTSDGRSGGMSLKPRTMLVIGGGLTITDTPEHGAPGLDALLFGGDGPRLDLLRALEAIDLAARDKHITGILLSGPLDAGLAQKAELRRALLAFKKSGKPVIAWLENASQGEYYLSSVADKAYAHVSGELEFKGLASYNLYFGETLRLLGVGVQVTKVGKYKSAVEPYLGATMSAEAREQAEVFMGGLWRRLSGEVAKSRSLKPEAPRRPSKARASSRPAGRSNSSSPTRPCTGTNSSNASGRPERPRTKTAPPSARSACTATPARSPCPAGATRSRSCTPKETSSTAGADPP